MNEVKIEKSTCERYTIRNSEFSGWAIITLSESGDVNIQSDYGNWGYLWPPHCRSKSLKEFLISIDHWYAWNKFSGKEEYDHEATIKSVEDHLKEDWHDYDAHLVKKAIQEVEDAYFENDIQYNCTTLESLGLVPHEFICRKPDHGFMMFYEKFWKPFIDHLKKEVSTMD